MAQMGSHGNINIHIKRIGELDVVQTHREEHSGLMILWFIILIIGFL